MQTYILNICWLLSIVLAYNAKGIVSKVKMYIIQQRIHKNRKLKAMIRQEVVNYLEELKS